MIKPLYISNNQLPREGLTQQEIKEKIAHLEKSIRYAWIFSLPCKNRIARVKQLRSYLIK